MMDEIRLIDANALDRYISGGQMNPPGDNRTDWNAAVNDTLDEVLETIKNAPAVNPGTLRPVAHWNGQYDGYSDGEPVYDIWECSNCGHIIDDGTDCEDDLPRYCPSCGAKMGSDE